MADEDWRARALKAEATLAQIETATHTPDGVQEYLHHHDPSEGYPECPACWVQTILQIMGITEPARLPAYAIPIRRVDATATGLFPVQDHPLPGDPPPIDLIGNLRAHLRATFYGAMDHQQEGRPSIPRTDEEVLDAIDAGDADAVMAWLEDEVIVPGRAYNSGETYIAHVELANVPCAAARDGECDWALCPQVRDGEPAATGRHCPLDRRDNGE